MIDLTLSPSQTEFTIKPGNTLTQAYDITNNSKETVFLTSSIEGWQPFGNDGSVSYNSVISNPNINFSLNNSDLKLGQGFSLKPSEKRQLVLKIQTTTQTQDSDNYFTFFVSQDLSNSIDQSNSQVNAKIGSHILLSVSSDSQVEKSADIINFHATPKFKDIFFNQINFQGEIENKTNHFLKTQGKITITKNNKIIKELPLFPSNVLSNYTRKINCLENNSIVPCTLKPPFWPGVYNAKITLDPSISAKSVSISFFVFPYFLVGLFLIISIIGFIFYKSKH